MITVARIGKIHGINGDIKLHSFTDYPNDIMNFKKFYLDDGNPIKIKFIKKKGEAFLCKVDSVLHPDGAKKLVNRFVLINEKELPELTNGNFYFNQLQKMQVHLNSKKIGNVISVNNHGAGDYLEVRTIKNKIILIPFIKSHISNTDLKTNTINLNPIYFSDDI